MCAGKIHDMFVSRHKKLYQKCARDYTEICQLLSEQVHAQYFYGCKYISMEGISLEHFKKLKPYTILMAQFNSYLSNEIN